MQENQARCNKQRSAASLIVLHARRADRLLLASNGHVIRVRPKFGLSGTKFADVIQFISRAGSVCRLRGQLRVIAGCIFPVPVLLGGLCRSIQSSEPSRIYFERSFKFVLCLFWLTRFEQKTAELFANRNERSGRNGMFA